MAQMQIPNHLGVILDGNRRWAKSRGLNTWEGHKKGAKKFEDFLNWCLDMKIPKVSVYALSSDNIRNRKKKEVEEIFKLMKKNFDRLLNEKFDTLQKNEVQVRVLGDYRKLPKSLLRVARKLMQKTSGYQKHILNLLIAYKGMEEILFGIKKIVRMALSGRVRITTKLMEKNLLESEPIDLIIRTGGRSRLSDFMPLQSAYSEIYVTKTLWPDFSKREFIKAINWFSSIQRNYGK